MSKVVSMVAPELVGDMQKDGVILECNGGFNFYDGSGDNNLKTIKVATKYTRAKDGMKRVLKSKVYEPVKVANNQMTVTVYPDGRIEITPNSK